MCERGGHPQCHFLLMPPCPTGKSRSHTRLGGFGRLRSTGSRCSQQFSTLPPARQVTKSPRTQAETKFLKFKTNKQQTTSSLQTSPSQGTSWARGCPLSDSPSPAGPAQPSILPCGAPEPTGRLERNVRGFSPQSPKKVRFWVQILRAVVSISEFCGAG